MALKTTFIGCWLGCSLLAYGMFLGQFRHDSEWSENSCRADESFAAMLSIGGPGAVIAAFGISAAAEHGIMFSCHEEPR